MRFSIIVCTYNTSKSLPATLDSILTQTCSDYEVVIVDGASTDGTQEIIKDYEKKFSGQLRWISETDSGIYDAMNKGIDMAQGEWIYFLGCDDTFHSDDVLEKIAEEIKKNDTDVVYGNVMWGKTGKIYDGEFSSLKLIRKNICHQSIFFKKILFQKFGKYDLKYKVLADHVFNMRWFSDGNVRRLYVNLIVANYNLDGKSSTSCAPDEQFTKDRRTLIKKYFPEEYGEVKKQPEQKERLRQLEREITLMKSSVFWRLRGYYLKFKSLFSKNHL